MMGVLPAVGFEVVNGLAGRHLVLDAVMVFAAGPLIYLLFAAGALAVLVGLRGRDRSAQLWMVGQVGAALLVGFLISRVIRLLAIHERPFQYREVTQLVDHDPGVSFPSNHATAALAVALVVWVFVAARWGAILAGPAVLVAISRVFVGVHWLSDIVSAAVVAAVAVALVWWIARMLRQRRPQAPTPTAADDQPTVVLSRIDGRTPTRPNHTEQTVVLPQIPDGGAHENRRRRTPAVPPRRPGFRSWSAQAPSQATAAR
jgi:undecaprenyl-diphosphatase